MIQINTVADDVVEQTPFADFNLPFSLHALLRFRLQERGEIVTAVMRAFATDAPSEDQRVLRLLFDGGPL